MQRNKRLKKRTKKKKNKPILKLKSIIPPQPPPLKQQQQENQLQLLKTIKKGNILLRLVKEKGSKIPMSIIKVSLRSHRGQRDWKEDELWANTDSNLCPVSTPSQTESKRSRTSWSGAELTWKASPKRSLICSCSPRTFYQTSGLEKCRFHTCLRKKGWRRPAGWISRWTHLISKFDNLSLIHKVHRRRELTPLSCPLTFTCML